VTAGLERGAARRGLPASRRGSARSTWRHRRRCSIPSNGSGTRWRAAPQQSSVFVERSNALGRGPARVLRDCAAKKGLGYRPRLDGDVGAMSLLRDIQEAAGNLNTPLQVALHHCMMLADRLGPTPFKEWVEEELSGY